MLYNRVVLELSNELKLLEDIFISNWITRNKDLHMLINGENKIWLPGENTAMSKSDMLKKYNQEYISKHARGYPYHITFCITYLKDWILGSIYNDKPDPVDFERNRLTNKGKNFMPNHDTIIEEYIPDEVLEYFNKDVIKEISSICNNILEVVRKYTDLYPKNVFDIEYLGDNLVVVNKGEIGTYRYNEYLNMKG